jgi:superfamily II DNA or RNA helicase
MTTILWPHQRAAVAAAAAAVAVGRPSGLWVIPTGAGKTFAFLTLARDLGGGTLVLVHRDELIAQTVRSAAAVWPGASVGVVQGARAEWAGRDLVVASVPSLRPGRLAGVPRDRFKLLVADECHHLPAPTWQQAVRHFTPRFLLGATATPDRLDGRGLASWFGPRPLYTYPLRQAVADGILVPVRQLAVNTHVDLDEVALCGGDFAVGQLALAVATAARDRVVVEAYKAHAGGRKAIAFAVNRAHVGQLAASFLDAGVEAVAVTGATPPDDRRNALAAFAAGKYRVLVNCEICTEGFDDRGVSCILMARPTRSRALYQQCLGRGLRQCPEAGKQDCLVLDMTDNCRRHRLVTAADLLGSGPAAAGAAANRDGGERDEQMAHLPAPAVTPPRYSGPVAWSWEEVPPWPELPSLQGYRPGAWWHHQPASEKQLQALRRFGLTVVKPLTKGEASFLLEQCIDYAERELATPRQEFALRRAGAWEPGLTKREASRRIGLMRAAVGC